MAFTFAKAGDTVFGNQRVIFGLLTTDSAAGTVAFGLNKITQVQVTPKSAPTSADRAVSFRINAGDTATAIAGTLALTGCVSGDTYYVTVYGS